MWKTTSRHCSHLVSSRVSNADTNVTCSAPTASDKQRNKKSPTNANGNVQQRCMFEISHHRAPDDRRLIIYSFLLVLTGERDMSHSANAVSAGNCKFSLPLLILHLRSKWRSLNLWKSFTVPETRVIQAANGENLMILACSVFHWSTHVTERWTGQTYRQTELQ